jgi:hypothetical protein
MPNLLVIFHVYTVLHRFIHEKLPPASILGLILFLDLLQVIVKLPLGRDSITSLTFVIRECAVL